MIWSFQDIYKFYDIKAVPGDGDIINDMIILLETYDRYIKLKNNEKQGKDNEFSGLVNAVSRVIKAIAGSGHRRSAGF